MLSFGFRIFCLYRGFCHRTGSDLLLFLSLFQTVLIKHWFVLKAFFTNVALERCELWSTNMRSKGPTGSVFSSANIALKRLLSGILFMRCFMGYQRLLPGVFFQTPSALEQLQLLMNIFNIAIKIGLPTEGKSTVGAKDIPYICMTIHVFFSIAMGDETSWHTPGIHALDPRGLPHAFLS